MRRRYTPRAGGVALALVASLAAGCGEDVTGVLITIEKEASLDLRGREVRIEVYGRADASQEWRPGASQPRVLGGEELSEPQTLLIRPQAGDATRQWRVVVSTASTAGPIEASRTGSFAAGRLLRVRIVLSDACAGITCPPGNTCIEGMCRSSSVDPPEDAGMDGGADGSGGGPDGGIDAGPDGTGGGTDGGVDAGRDGSGGGTDGGSSRCTLDEAAARAIHLKATESSATVRVHDVQVLRDGRVAAAGYCNKTFDVGTYSSSGTFEQLAQVNCSSAGYFVLVIEDDASSTLFLRGPVDNSLLDTSTDEMGAVAVRQSDAAADALKLVTLVNSGGTNTRLVEVVASTSSAGGLREGKSLSIASAGIAGHALVRVGNRWFFGGGYWTDGMDEVSVTANGITITNDLMSASSLTPWIGYVDMDADTWSGRLQGPDASNTFGLTPAGELRALATAPSGSLHVAGYNRANCAYGDCNAWAARAPTDSGMPSGTWASSGSGEVYPTTAVSVGDDHALLAGFFEGTVTIDTTTRNASDRGGSFDKDAFAVLLDFGSSSPSVAGSWFLDSDEDSVRPDYIYDAAALPDGTLLLAGHVGRWETGRQDGFLALWSGTSAPPRMIYWGQNAAGGKAWLHAVDTADALVAVGGRFQVKMDKGPGIVTSSEPGTDPWSTSSDTHGFVVTMPLRCR